MPNRVINKGKGGDISDMFEIFKTTIDVIADRGQKPQLMQRAFLNHLIKLRKELSKFDKTGLIPEDSWIIDNPKVISKNRIQGALYNNSKMFSIFFSGSATRNVDDTGSGPYDIYPKKPGGFLALHLSGNTGSYGVTKRLHTTKGEDRARGGPYPKGEPGQGADVGLGTFMDVSSKNVRVTTGKSTKRIIVSVESEHGRKIFDSTLKRNEDGSDTAYVKYVLNHPGRPPDVQFREAILKFMGVYDTFGIFDIPGQVMASFTAGIDPAIREFTPEHRFKGATVSSAKLQPDGGFLDSVDTVLLTSEAETMMIPGRLKVKTQTNLKPSDPYLGKWSR